ARAPVDTIDVDDISVVPGAVFQRAKPPAVAPAAPVATATATTKTTITTTMTVAGATGFTTTIPATMTSIAAAVPTAPAAPAAAAVPAALAAPAAAVSTDSKIDGGEVGQAGESSLEQRLPDSSKGSGDGSAVGIVAGALPELATSSPAPASQLAPVAAEPLVSEPPEASDAHMAPESELSELAEAEAEAEEPEVASDEDDDDDAMAAFFSSSMGRDVDAGPMDVDDGPMDVDDSPVEPQDAAPEQDPVADLQTATEASPVVSAVAVEAVVEKAALAPEPPPAEMSEDTESLFSLLADLAEPPMEDEAPEVGFGFQ
ncbi:unnamed protein product, partial [Polarella glacialis]